MKICGKDKNKFHCAYIFSDSRSNYESDYKKYDRTGEDIDDVM